MANILGGLMAGANFGTGYLQGQQTAQQQQYANRLNDLMIQNAQLEQQQRQLSVQQQQALSDDAMRAFSPTSPPAGTPDGPATPQVPQFDPSQIAGKLNELASSAASRGDLVHANQLWTNATNMENAQSEQQARQSDMQTAELKRQQAHYALAAQYAGSVPDTPDGFAQWKMSVLSDPMSSPEERQRVSAMQYRPGILQEIQQRGMTASEQAAAKMRQMQFEEQQRRDNMEEMHRQRQDAERAAHDRVMEQHRATQTKAGAAAKAPTSTQLDSVTQAVKDAMPNADVEGPNFDQARRSIAARAEQLAQGNRALTFPQAAAMAVEEAKKNGEFQNLTTPAQHFWQSDKSTSTFTPKGETPDTAMPFTGQPKSELIQGKFYKTGSGTLQWTGTGWRKL